MKRLLVITIASLALFTNICMGQTSKGDANGVQSIFPKGEKGSAENFTGNAAGVSMPGTEQL